MFLFYFIFGNGRSEFFILFILSYDVNVYVRLEIGWGKNIVEFLVLKYFCVVL